MLDLINRKQRQLLIHSYLYYELSENIISDSTFDQWSVELVNLKQNYPTEFQLSEYADSFRSFDGSTGMDLPYRLDSVIKAGNNLLRIHSAMKGGE